MSLREFARPLALLVVMLMPLTVGATKLDARIVAMYAADRGVTISEAKKHLQLQENAGDFSALVKKTIPEISGGVYIENSSKEFKLVVQLAAGDFSTIKPLLTGKFASLRPYVEARPVARSLIDLRAIMASASALSEDHGIHADFDIDVSANVATLNSTDPAEAAAKLDGLGFDFAGGLEVRGVQALARPLASIAGGLSINQCTSGFGVIHPDGQRGIITAAHCDNGQQYFQGTYLPWLDGAYGGEWDVQWHSTPGYTPTNLVWDGQKYFSITDLRYRGSQIVGEFVCKNGKTTGYGCGYIRSINFQPGNIPNAAPTWVTFGGSLTYADNGDSGAPIWKNNFAYGILSAVYYDYGYEEYRIVYMPSDGVAEGLGVYILVSP